MSPEPRTRPDAPTAAVALLSVLTVGCVTSRSVKQPHGIAPSASVVVPPSVILTRPTEISWEVGAERLVIHESVRSVQLDESDEDGLSLTSKVVSVHGRQFHDLSPPEQFVVDQALTAKSLDGLLVLRVSTTAQEDPESDYEELYTVTVVGHVLTLKSLGPMSAERADKLYAGGAVPQGDPAPPVALPADPTKKD